MPVRALVFGLRGALVPFSPKRYRAAVAEMARILTAPPYEFGQLWEENSRRRELTMLGTLDEDVRDVLRTLGVYTHLDQVLAAVDIIYRFEREALEAPKDTLAFLREARGRGYRIGLVSNTTATIARLWPESPMAPLVDAAVFSCEVGLRKPEAAIYLLAAERLGLAPAECLFAGATSGELSGAHAAGMAVSVMVSRPDIDPEDAAPPDHEPFSGPTVTSLHELLPVAAATGVELG